MKKRLITGITPSNTLTIGHYCGVLSHLKKVQKEREMLLMVADWHAITVPKAGFNYFERGRSVAALFLACGLDKKNCKVFLQSNISEHLELAHILSTLVTVSKMSYMIQFKEKSRKTGSTGNLSLLSYPILQAADVLLYDFWEVVVGEDQRQHLELASDVAKRFNNFVQQEVLRMPLITIPATGAKILDLRDPSKKMSKSDEGSLFLLDDAATIARKIGSAQTDSENKIYYDPLNKPGVSNLLVIYQIFSEKSMEEVLEMFAETNYSDFKKALVSLLTEKLSHIQKEYEKNLAEIDTLLAEGASYMKKQAKEKISLVNKAIKLR